MRVCVCVIDHSSVPDVFVDYTKRIPGSLYSAVLTEYRNKMAADPNARCAGCGLKKDEARQEWNHVNDDKYMYAYTCICKQVFASSLIASYSNSVIFLHLSLIDSPILDCNGPCFIQCMNICMNLYMFYIYIYIYIYCIGNYLPEVMSIGFLCHPG